jgi:hypothetical protein
MGEQRLHFIQPARFFGMVGKFMPGRGDEGVKGFHCDSLPEIGTRIRGCRSCEPAAVSFSWLSHHYGKDAAKPKGEKEESFAERFEVHCPTADERCFFEEFTESVPRISVHLRPNFKNAR